MVLQPKSTQICVCCRAPACHSQTFHFFSAESAGVHVLATRQEKYTQGLGCFAKGNLMSIHFTVMAFCKLATCVSLAPQLQDVTTFNTPRSCPPMFYLFSVTQGQLRPPQNTPNMRKREPKIGQANYSVACLQPTKVLPDITNLQREVGGCSLLCGSKMQNNNCIVPWNCDRNGSIFLFLALVRWRTRSFRQSCHV